MTRTRAHRRQECHKVLLRGIPDKKAFYALLRCSHSSGWRDGVMECHAIDEADAIEQNYRCCPMTRIDRRTSTLDKGR